MPALLVAGLVVASLTGRIVPPPVHHPYARPHHLHGHGRGRIWHAPRPSPTPVPRPAAGAPPATAPVQAPPGADDVEEIEAVEAVSADAAPGTAAGGEAPKPGQAAPAGAQGGEAGTAGPGHAGVPVTVYEPMLPEVPRPEGSVLTVAGIEGIAGHEHAALVHLPIAWVLLWAGVELLSLVTMGPALGAFALGLGVVTTLSFVPALFSGLCRFEEFAGTQKSYDVGPGLLHRNIMVVAAALCGVGVLLRIIERRWPNVICRLACLLCVLVACALTSYSAHIGGRMVYGDDFLPF